MTQAQKDEIVAQAKLAHQTAQLHSLEANEGEVFIVHRHTTAAERRIYRELRQEGKVLDAQDAILSCVVYPARPELMGLIDQAPFIVEIIENAILAASGLYLDAVRKKL